MIMKIFNTARDLILYPEKTWDVLKEIKDNKFIFTYPLVLSFVQPLAIIVGYGVVGLWVGQIGYFRLSLSNAFYSALVAYFLSLLGVVVAGFLILVIANYFSAEGDINSAMKLAVFSSTAPLLAGIFQIIPGIRILTVLAMYGAYLLYVGIPKIMKAPHDKESPFIFSAIIATIILMLLINSLITQYIFGILYSDILTY
jgi:hypothetical protein